MVLTAVAARTSVADGNQIFFLVAKDRNSAMQLPQEETLKKIEISLN